MSRRLIGEHPYLAFGTIAATAFLLHTCSKVSLSSLPLPTSA